MSKKFEINEVLSDLKSSYSAQYFLGEQGDPCISLIENSYKKTMLLRSSQWLSWMIRYVRRQNIAISSYVRDEITAELCALADGESRKNVQVRIARAETSIQVDLSDESYQVAMISDSQRGFKLCQPEEVFLFRSKKQTALPRPIEWDRDEFIKAFKELMPKFTNGHWLLALAFILKALNRDRGAFPILLISGSQGSGKTTLSRRIKALIDPSEPAELSPPKSFDDIIVAARNAYLLVYENMSGISHEMADVFCRLATGGGISKRQLYTDHEEVFYKIHRPVIINGIDEPSNRPDFLDRCVSLELKPMDAGQRVAETELNNLFEAHRSRFLGGLYALLADCLMILPTIQEKGLPRMADYALIGIAMERVLNLKPGLFLEVYGKNRTEQVENAFWNDDLCEAIYKKLQRTPGNRIEGSAHELMKTLFDRRQDPVNAPRTARAFTGSLKRIEPILKMKNIVVERPPRMAEKRLIVIRSEIPLRPQKSRGFIDPIKTQRSSDNGLL